MSTFPWRFPLQDVLLRNGFSQIIWKQEKVPKKTVNILKNKNTTLSGQMINKLSAWQDFMSVGIPS